MLDSVFGFKGRIGRVRYLLSCMALGPALLFLFVALLFAFGFHPSVRGSFIKPMILAGLAVVPLWFWTSLSLQACRLRDIGLDPVPALATWMGLNFVLRLFDQVVVRSQIGTAHVVDPIGAIQLMLGGLVALALLLWPGWRGEDDDGGADLDDEGRAPPTPTYRLPVAVQPVTPAATGFGRRGLSPGRTGSFPAR